MATRLENNYFPPSNARSSEGSDGFYGAPSFGGLSSSNLRSSGSQFGSGGTSYYAPSSARFSGTNLGGSSLGQYNRVPLRNNFSGRSSYNGGPQLRILRFNNDNSGTGDYSFAFETENQIRQQEVGEQRVVGNEQATNVRGSYSYVTPEGQQVSVNYVADENGFRAEGDHLPTQPAIQSFQRFNSGSNAYYTGDLENSRAYQEVKVGGARNGNRQYLTPVIARAGQETYKY
ncbi:pupal cuticle protein 20-like [Euwallacea similis]|uniref:pupal cuticle protein 20-like n=1 Tax=Euwallacea similis TaxID=1736056 RepID=UPI00344BB1C4